MRRRQPVMEGRHPASTEQPGPPRAQRRSEGPRRALCKVVEVNTDSQAKRLTRTATAGVLAAAFLPDSTRSRSAWRRSSPAGYARLKRRLAALESSDPLGADSLLLIPRVELEDSGWSIESMVEEFNPDERRGPGSASAI